jgi:hypothetical protein
MNKRAGFTWRNFRRSYQCRKISRLPWQHWTADQHTTCYRDVHISSLLFHADFFAISRLHLRCSSWQARGRQRYSNEPETNNTADIERLPRPHHLRCLVASIQKVSCTGSSNFPMTSVGFSFLGYLSDLSFHK